MNYFHHKILEMKNWIGKFLIGIGVLHTLVGVVLLTPLVGEELLADGLFNSINGQPKREAFLWFLLSGFFMIIIGALLNFMEKNRQMIPDFLGWSLIAVAAFAVFFSPLSGGWLIFIPAIALVLYKPNPNQ